MATSTKRLSLSSPSSYTSSKQTNLNDLLQKFYTKIENLKQNHENDIENLNKKIKELESENKHLRTIHEQHPHSIFDIDYVSNDSSTINQLQSELDRAKKQIDVLHETLNQQYSEYEDMKTKYNLQRLMNENHFEQQNSTTDLNKIKELELKLKQIKDQINQFDQCNYESDEQIRLLKQLILNNDQEQINTIKQSLTVKKSDLFQQTDIVENILNKQQDKIIEKIMELFEKNPRYDQQTTTKNKKTKKKRL
jgi:chromosome segregation ATPase